MEIRVTQPFLHKGQRVEAGEVIDLTVADAAYVVGLGRAAYVADADEAPTQPPRKGRKAKAE